jgi:hypothetical protein
MTTIDRRCPKIIMRSQDIPSKTSFGFAGVGAGERYAGGAEDTRCAGGAVAGGEIRQQVRS